MQMLEHPSPRTTPAQRICYRDASGQLITVRQSKTPICAPPCKDVKCVDCQDQYYSEAEQKQDLVSYSTIISPTQAREKLGQLVSEIGEDREFLRTSLERHGDRILSRWKKKSQGQREAWVLHADPKLFPKKWFIAEFSIIDLKAGENQAHRESFLHPYLSVELLATDPSIFLALLHNRSKYPPESWAPFDSKQLQHPWGLHYLEVEFCEQCVVMHGPNYGQLVPWEAEAAHRLDIIGYPRAQLILEAQKSIMTFLRRTVEQIITSVDPESPSLSSKWTETTRTGFKNSGDTAIWSRHTHQAFSAPPTFDIDYLLSQAKLRLEAKGDHLWLLQTDPTYMRQFMQETFQCEVMKKAEQEQANKMMLQELNDDLRMYWFWQWVYEEFEHVKQCAIRSRHHIHAGEALPLDYNKTLGALELLLVNRMRERALHMSAIIPQRPGFRHLWKFRPVDGTPNKIRFERVSNMDFVEAYKNDRLDWGLSQLLGEPDNPNRIEHSVMFDFLDQHRASSPAKERARLDPLILEILSDYAAVHELLVAVRLHRPLSTSRELSDVKKNDDRRVWRHGARPPILTSQDFQLLAGLLGTFAKAPVPKGHKDAEYLQHFDGVHNALGKFWKTLHNAYGSSLRKSGKNDDEAQTYLEIFSSYSSVKYVESLQAERDSITASITKHAESGLEATQRRYENLSMNEKVPRGQIDMVKPKVKTRGKDKASTVVVEVEEDVEPGHVPAQETKAAVLVKARTLEILQAMYATSPADNAKSIDWPSFVQAMGNAGFTARNGGGSAVIFEAAGAVGSGGRIIFHKPHPVEKIDPIMLRSIGKRMTKWFGWCREMFGVEV